MSAVTSPTAPETTCPSVSATTMRTPGAPAWSPNQSCAAPRHPGSAMASGAVPIADPGWRGAAQDWFGDLLRWFERDTDVTRVDLFATRFGAPIYAARGFTVREFPAMCLPVPR